jgi:phage gp29-like protein
MTVQELKNQFTINPIRNDGLNNSLRYIYDQSPKTMQLWQTARLLARANRYYNQQWPLKYYLIDFYDEILKDAHLSAMIQNRKAKVLGEAWSIVDSDNVKDPEAEQLLQKKWFTDFCDKTIDAKFYGYSLIELDDTNNDGFIDQVHCIERRNVVPEYNSIRIYPTDINNGIDLKELPNCILIDTKELGLLETAGPLILYKRSALASWTEHAELFSAPFIVAKSDVNDKTASSRLKNDMRTLGRERIAVIAQGEEIDIKDQGQSDTFRIYNELIARTNSEIAKLFVGQTMTSDQGSSYSQADVHKDTAQEIAEQDQQWVADWVNDALFPRLIEIGYPLTGKRFKWNISRMAPLNDRIKLFEMLSKNYDIAASVIEETFGVQVTAKLQQPDATVIEKNML